MRYEDMKEQPEQELTRIAKFLGIDALPELLRTTLERSSARPHARNGKDTGQGLGFDQR